MNKRNAQEKHTNEKSAETNSTDRSVDSTLGGDPVQDAEFRDNPVV
jgi:hypothetical protein